ncbi:hypothetical protein SAY86_030804 [Trapa natans]|uniref:BHLH domain-containing protein n=1 Tax=Trapa natans TaxID=22666 RepID=A0AAN7LYF0_TRANT|nr:hypothetical protein SAY86_030804 [Trapa natans]
MSQCVPDWDVDENPIPTRLSGRSNSSSIPSDVPVLDYEVAELTWENGQLAMHGLGQPRVYLKPQPQSQPQPQALAAALPNSKYTWDKLPRGPVAGTGTSTGTGTLESIVHQAANTLPQRKQPLPPAFENLVPWFDRPAGQHASSATMTMDALVPCAAATASAEHQHQRLSAVPPACVVGCSTHVGSCSGAGTTGGLQEGDARKRSRVAATLRVPVVGAGEWSGRDQYSVSGSATVGRERVDSGLQMTVETCEREVYTSMGSQDNTSSGAIPGTRATATATADEHDSVCHSQSQKEAGDEDGDDDDKVKRNGKSSVSTKRSRAAAIHNQSERKRRDKINQRMKTLQKLVPNSSKTDKASVLDEVIEYLKQLQAQVQMMSRMNMQPMMMAAMQQQQQLQMSMMAAAPMGLSMGMGAMGMAGVVDMSSLARPNLPGLPPNVPTPIIHPMAAAAAASTTPFLSMGPPWDGSSCNGDPFSAFLACQSQPMTLDAYSRMAAMYQQLHQPPASSSKN